MLIPHKGHTDTTQVYSVTVMTHVKALQAGHSSQGTSEPITPAPALKPNLLPPGQCTYMMDTSLDKGGNFPVTQWFPINTWYTQTDTVIETVAVGMVYTIELRLSNHNQRYCRRTLASTQTVTVICTDSGGVSLNDGDINTFIYLSIKYI